MTKVARAGRYIGVPRYYVPRHQIGTQWSCRLTTCAVQLNASVGKLPRVYRYSVDVHGQLFLYDTIPKNLTSCFKDPRFLNFFYDRVAYIKTQMIPETALPLPPPTNWHEQPHYMASLPSPVASAALSLARSQGYSWLSDCQEEWNLIKLEDAHGTPIVFRELAGEEPEEGAWDRLRWAGNRFTDFQPSKLRVCPDSGYLYHPSPYPATVSWRRRLAEDRLDMDSSRGAFLWKGKRWQIETLQAGDISR